MEKPVILIVDDEPSNLSILNMTLESLYKVRAANSGERALQIVLTEPRPDLILLDIMMPEMDGYEVLEKLKADPQTSNISVIFYSIKIPFYNFKLNAVWQKIKLFKM